MAIGLAMGQTIVLQRKFDPVDWLRLLDTYTGDDHVLGAHADPDDLQRRPTT